MMMALSIFFVDTYINLVPRSYKMHTDSDSGRECVLTATYRYWVRKFKEVNLPPQLAAFRLKCKLCALKSHF